MKDQQPTHIVAIPVIGPGFKASLPRPPAVARPELVHRIEAGMEGRLVLVSAPAGWGKTSTVAEWANQSNLPVAWVTCDVNPADPNSLIREIVSAFGHLCEGFGNDLGSMLRSARPIPTVQLMAMLKDAIAEWGSPFVLVLDDFHLVRDPELISEVFALATSGVGKLRVVIASRTSPAWPLARLRAYGQVTELGPADLAFSAHEAAALIGSDAIDMPLLNQLVERSEGWVTGIRLARLWLEHRGDPVAVVDAFHGSHRDVADYLTEEVFSFLPDDVESFLLATSVPDTFNASLAQALADDINANEMLEQIERQGLFLVPMDAERFQYRYHPLFREFLQARLVRRTPERERDLYRRVASWHEAENSLVEAAEYRLRSGDVEDAARLIDQVAENLLLQQGETHTLICLVEHIPRETLQRFPTLLRFYAWGLVLVGRLDEAEALAGQFESRREENAADQERKQRAELAGIRSRIAAYRGDHEGTIAYAQAALELASPSHDWFRADAYLSLGFALRAVGRTSEAADAFGRASMLGWTCKFPHAALWGTRYQAITSVSQGQLLDADDLIDGAMQSARNAGIDQGAAFAALLVGRGELRYERNDLEGCRRDLTQALELARQVGDAKILMNVYVALALLEEAEGHHEKARLTSRRAVRVFDGSGENANEAWLALRQGDLPTVKRWMDAYCASEGREASLSKGESEQIMLGRALLAMSDPREARMFLADLLAQAESSGRWGRSLVIRVLQANADDADGNEDLVVEHVKHVLDIAMRERYVRSILDEGQAFLRILRRTMRQENDAKRRQYASVLLAAAESRSDRDAFTDAFSGLVEPLTVRQRDVLRLIVEGLSNREVADELFVTEGTVKAHLHQIYGKLMVRNRAEAIKAANDLQIFP